jgi:hypothetical protein
VTGLNLGVRPYIVIRQGDALGGGSGIAVGGQEEVRGTVSDAPK